MFESIMNYKNIYYSLIIVDSKWSEEAIGFIMIYFFFLNITFE